VTLLEGAVASLLAGALTSLALARRRRASGWVSVAFVSLAAVLLWWAAIRVFIGAAGAERTLLAIPAVHAALAIRVDALGAIFLAIIATIAVPATLFSVHYMDRFAGDTVAKYYPVLLVLFAGIVGVVTTADFLFFLVFWELMTLASFFLVAFERESREAQRAALEYFVVNQAAALGMLAAALVLWRTGGSFHFDAFRDALGTLLAGTPWLGHLVLLLLFLGFTTKGGVLPMGSWLANAYPAAPTPATAAFSGMMTKLGIYGLLRVFLHLLPLSPATTAWGVIIAIAGVGSLFVGTLTALRQDDAKKLMSFHVIGQMGYMLLGVGAGLALLRTDPLIATLALLGGVFHMINNSLYKSGLFLSAGALEYRVGTRSLAALPGGLGAFMAGTAACTLIAALAIAGVPPLNGFASKWLLYASGILGSRIAWLLAVAVLVALFISLATLASFLKYMGGAFLGVPRPGLAPREVPASMLAPQVLLAALCVLFGLVPMLPLHYVHMALADLPSATTLPALGTLFGDGAGLAIARDGLALAAWQPLPVALLLILLGLFAYFAVQRAGGATVRDVPVWLGGEPEAHAAVHYTPGSFYRPFKEAFHGIYPSARIRPPAFPAWLRASLELDRWLYHPLIRGAETTARGVSRTHVGLLQVYLLWIILGAAAVLALVFFLGGAP